MILPAEGRQDRAQLGNVSLVTACHHQNLTRKNSWHAARNWSIDEPDTGSGKPRGQGLRRVDTAGRKVTDHGTRQPGFGRNNVE